MDMFCQVCGEPWDLNSLSLDFKASEKEKFLKGQGCPSCKWGEAPVNTGTFRSQLASAVSDLLGDDIDGIASEMEDAELMFGSEFWE